MNDFLKSQSVERKFRPWILRSQQAVIMSQKLRAILYV